jgi:tetratricopeptide (TPR) repeat protein
MVQMFFFLRFKAQLRRTRPELVPRLEDSAAKAVAAAGGKITGKSRFLTASFDGDSLGFWLDMLILIESLMKELDAAADELFGYSLILGRDLLDGSDASGALEALCRYFAGDGRGGVFLDRIAGEGLLPYALVEEPESPGRSRAGGDAAQSGTGGFYRLGGLKRFAQNPKGSSLRESVTRAFDQGLKRRNTLILGPAFAAKREGLYRFCEEIAGDFPPLLIRFGAGGLTALIDSWSPQIRALGGPLAADTGEIQGLWEFLFRERLREELSDFIIKKARLFFVLLLEFYTGVARRKARPPILILENIQQAEQSAVELFLDAYAGIKRMNGLVVLGTWDETTGEKMDKRDAKKWEAVFPRMIRPNTDGLSLTSIPELPKELWEIGYALSLFGRYFPASLFLQLLEEEGKNPVMISRALSLLSVIWGIDTPQESHLRTADFAEKAEMFLGARKKRVQAMVCRRLLAWVEQKKLNYCFRLLIIFAGMGAWEYLDDTLILKSIVSDLVNGTAAGVEQARNNGLLESLAGPERAAAVRYIFETTRALLSGGAGAIDAAFKELPPDCAAFPVLKAQTLINLSAYHLGLRDTASAIETIKEASFSSQSGNKLCLAQSYRLFSLVSLSRQRAGEAIDYLGFALDSAEKSGNYHEMGVSAYYAAAAQFLFGNVSRAALLARKAREYSLTAGCPEWADRSLFFEGRLAFEMGSYQRVIDLFEGLLKEPQGGASPEKKRLLAAWTYRARVYFRTPLSPKPASGGHDADLFEVEAAYLAGNYQKTVELAEALGASPYTEKNYLYTEQPDWHSGFAQCELLCFSSDDLWNRMLHVYHSLALCRLSAAGSGKAMHNMQQILKSEQLSEMDPWDAFYYYAWYRILEQSGAEQVDMNTAISMAFKRLQRRASRIDDVEIRRQFLSQPRWNGALSQAAREYKLI